MRARRVAVVVPVHDGERCVAAAVEALAATTGDDVAICLVDDASRDASLAVLRDLARAHAPRVAVLARATNGGFAAAVNTGVGAALSADPGVFAVVLVNQDCVVRRGWLEPLLDALGDPSVGIVGARLLEADGVTLAHAGGRIEANGLTSHVGRGLVDSSAFREAADVDYVCGALVALRAADWKGLDEGYAPAYFEDVDLCMDLRRSGRRVVYVPAAEAVHSEASTSGRGSALFLARYHRNRLRFVVRHLLHGRRALAWAAAEARWLAAQGRWHDVKPVLAAYRQLPRFVREARDARRSRRLACAGGGA